VLGHLTKGNPHIVAGRHISLPSVLEETHDWLDQKASLYDFVEPEIGNLAQSSLTEGVGFGFLHIISDNLSKKYAYDLSNERLSTVVENRHHLLCVVQDVLEKFFDESGPFSSAQVPQNLVNNLSWRL
jgi:hypothetical protein